MRYQVPPIPPCTNPPHHWFVDSMGIETCRKCRASVQLPSTYQEYKGNEPTPNEISRRYIESAKQQAKVL